MAQAPRIGIVIVSYGHQQVISDLIAAINDQRKPGDQLVIVDNHPDHLTAELADKTPGVDHVVRAENKGFSAGCNTGADKVINRVDLLYFMNPDTMLEPGALQAVRDGMKLEYDAWMSLLLLPDGRVNSAGNVVHLSGLSWCDGYGDVADRWQLSKEISVLSGACMAVRVEVWRVIGGMTEEYFLYYEDTDLSTRLLLAGYKLGLVPSSHVSHDYDYAKNNTKWLYIERNRWLYILRTWPLPVLVLLLPELIVMELLLWLIALMQRRFWLRVRSVYLFLKVLPQGLVGRRTIQRSRKLSARSFLQTLVTNVDTPLLGAVSRIGIVSRLFDIYKQALLFVLR